MRADHARSRPIWARTEATFPQAWVQTCIVHLIRASLRYVNYRDRKKVASALRPIYTAPNAEQALIELERFEQT
jgi:putative transposase